MGEPIVTAWDSAHRGCFVSEKTHSSFVEAFLTCTLLPDGTEYAATHTVAKMTRAGVKHGLLVHFELFGGDNTEPVLRLTNCHRGFQCQGISPRPLQDAEAEFEINTVATATGVVLPASKPRLHFARLQDVLIWPLPCAG